METLGNLHQMHMKVHPSMLHPEIISSISAQANIQGQQPKSPHSSTRASVAFLSRLRPVWPSHTLDQKGKNEDARPCL